jgi:hypothetical protein
MEEKEIKTRNYAFTINNYRDDDLESFENLASALDKHHYICYGLEIAPTTNTKHIQGYIQLNDAQRYSYLHNYFNFQKDGAVLKFHVEIANGTPEQNKKYCQKDGDFYEFGEPVTQGARTDLKEIKEKIKENPKNLNQIIHEHGNNYQQLKYAESLPKYYLHKRNPDTPPKVFWIFGSTGIGKTKLVSKMFDDICYVSSYKWLGTDYNQNECFCLDDFREFDLPFNIILKITDRYPFTLEFKGSQIPLNSPFIIFTSPKSIDETFHSTTEDIKQLKRRVVEINLDSIANRDDIDLRNLDEKYIYNPVNYHKDDF